MLFRDQSESTTYPSIHTFVWSVYAMLGMFVRVCVEHVRNSVHTCVHTAFHIHVYIYDLKIHGFFPVTLSEIINHFMGVYRMCVCKLIYSICVYTHGCVSLERDLSCIWPRKWLGCFVLSPYGICGVPVDEPRWEISTILTKNSPDVFFVIFSSIFIPVLKKGFCVIGGSSFDNILTGILTYVRLT